MKSKYKVPFVNYPLQYRLLKNEVNPKIHDLLSRGELYLREETQTFEKNFASFIGCKYGISVNSCTDAMLLSLHTLGLCPHDEVITVSHTYVSTIEAIVRCGTRPVLIDVGKDHNMDVDKLRAAITTKTRAIIPVHLNGHCCRMDEILEIARERGLSVIEDAAQAVGAKYRGKIAGSTSYAGCFSFYPSKILGCYGDGGMITTNDKIVANRLYALRDNGEKPKYMMTKQELKMRYITEFGFMSVLDNIQAGVLNVKMKYLQSWIKRRRYLADLYLAHLPTVDNFETMPSQRCDDSMSGTKRYQPPSFYDVYQNYVVMSNKRDKLQKHLEKNGVETLISWRIPNHKQPKLYMKFDLPVTEKISEEVLSLPMYPELTDDQVDYVCETIREFK